MVEFGDELMIESYKLQWLIWIQLIVMILLIVILFFEFNVFASDPSTTSSAAAASPLPGRSAAPPAHLDNAATSSRVINMEDERASRDEITNGGSIREDDHQSGGESSLKDPVFVSIFRRPNHPCNYIGIAKQALFKCFGLDSTYESSSSRQHEKHE